VPAYGSGGISADMYSDSTAYTLLVDDVLVSSSAATVPVITSQPAPITTNAGSTVAFSVTAVSTAPMSYAWFDNGTRLSDGGNISGASTAVLTLANVSGADAGDYVVVVTNVAGSVTSSPARLTVETGVPPSLLSQPRSQTVVGGQSAT